MTGSRGGFALPAVLGVTALLALVFASGASALAALGQSARTAIDLAEFNRLALSAEAEAAFNAATAPFAADGLDIGRVAATSPADRTPRHAALRFDGRPYAWRPAAARGLQVSLQDEAGLINLDASRPDALLRLFARLGLTAVEAETLRDQLLDALDGDADKRPRGAERPDYVARGRPAPAPGGFADLSEVNGVLDWPALVVDRRRLALETWATADPASQAFNLNTAGPEVLAIVLNLRPEAAQRIVQAREAAPLTALSQVGLPDAANAAANPVRANGRLRFTFTDVRRGFTYSSRIAPGADAVGPPRIAASARLARIQPQTRPADAPAFPDPADPTPAR